MNDSDWERLVRDAQARRNRTAYESYASEQKTGWKWFVETVKEAVINFFKPLKQIAAMMSNDTSANGGGGGNNSNSSSPDNQEGSNNMKISAKVITWIVVLVLAIILTPMMVGINDAGFRTVTQSPSGTMDVIFKPGVYVKMFANTTEYPDVITYDYDEGATARQEATLSDDGINVRYQDGGTGTVYGKDRFRLPNDKESMLLIHKEFRSAEGIGNRLIRPLVKESHNLTAGLMSSESAYAEKRGTYISWSQDQTVNGKYVTELTLVKEVNPVTGETENRQIPVIKNDSKTGQPMHVASPLRDYGISTSSGQITKWDFEPKTLSQISAKRDAMMAIITARAEAERAKQDAATLEAKGQANVIKAKYQRMEENAKEISDAEKAVKVAEQQKLQAVQEKLAAAEYKQTQILKGEGDAAYKAKVMQADGALQQKLDAWKEVNFKYAEAVAQQKWVPEVQMGGGSGSGTNAQAVIDMFAVKTAKDLGLDMKMKANNKGQ